MDFNINNESFADAFICLVDANTLLETGLGDFNELDASALNLINKQNVENSFRLSSAIAECQELKKKMYKTIVALSEINVESAEYFNSAFGDLNNYISFSYGSFIYEVDLDYILVNYNNGRNLALVEGGLGNYYKDKHATYDKGVKVIEEELRKIWDNPNYTIREKIVNGSLKHIQLGVDVGRKVNYKFAGTQGDGSNNYKVSVHSATVGIDCNAKVSFDIFNVVGDECGIGWLSVPEFYKSGEEISIGEWDRVQPADIFVRRDPDGPGGESQHVGLIVRNNSSDMTFDVTESRGPGYGIVARTISYDDMEKEGFIIKNMGSFYGE